MKCEFRRLSLEERKSDSAQSARCEEVAKYIIESGATVRSAASYFGISKSTVHKEMTTRLRYISYPMYVKVREILDLHKAQRHIRGGEATKKKYAERGGLGIRIRS